MHTAENAKPWTLQQHFIPLLYQQHTKNIMYFSLQALMNLSVTTCAKATITIHLHLVKMDLN